MQNIHLGNYSQICSDKYFSKLNTNAHPHKINYQRKLGSYSPYIYQQIRTHLISKFIDDLELILKTNIIVKIKYFENVDNRLTGP